MVALSPIDCLGADILNLQPTIGAAGTVSGINRICGGVWNAITNNGAPATACTFSTPFRVGVHFDSDEILGANDGNIYDNAENRFPANGLAGLGYQGFQLAYWQNTC